MRQEKKHTTKQQIAALAKENKQMFGLLIQLSQEVQFIGGMGETTLNVLKQMDNYEELVEKMKESLPSQDTQEESQSPLTEEKEYNVHNIEEPTEDLKANIDFGDE